MTHMWRSIASRRFGTRRSCGGALMRNSAMRWAQLFRDCRASRSDALATWLGELPTRLWIASIPGSRIAAKANIGAALTGSLSRFAKKLFGERKIPQWNCNFTRTRMASWRETRHDLATIWPPAGLAKKGPAPKLSTRRLECCWPGRFQRDRRFWG